MDNIAKGDLQHLHQIPLSRPGESRGFGFHEAPRGILSHWIVIEDNKIKNYQCVVPSTWNAGPAQSAGRPGSLRGRADRQPRGRPENGPWR